MLTISKPLSAGQAQTLPPEGVHCEGTELLVAAWRHRGEWQGRLAGQFGLVGAVSAEDFAKLSQGQHPQTGEQLVATTSVVEYQDADGKTIKTMEHRAGWDATFPRPKSVSLTALVAVTSGVREAHRESVGVASTSSNTTRKLASAAIIRPKPRAGLVAAKFEHDTAPPSGWLRCAAAATRTQSFSTSLSGPMVSLAQFSRRASSPRSNFATAIYQSELTYKLPPTRLRNHDGQERRAEIKGYTQEYLDASSPRSQQIREYLERRDAPARKLPRLPRTRPVTARRFIHREK